MTANSEPQHIINDQSDYETVNQSSELIASTPVETPNTIRRGSLHYTYVTGYSSTPDQTDDTPFITAAGTHVRVGVVAANWLPLGSKIQIPELFGDRVFVVEDRMNARFTDRLDIWFPDRESAISFGKNRAKIIIL